MMQGYSFCVHGTIGDKALAAVLLLYKTRGKEVVMSAVSLLQKSMSTELHALGETEMPLMPGKQGSKHYSREALNVLETSVRALKSAKKAKAFLIANRSAALVQNKWFKDLRSALYQLPTDKRPTVAWYQLTTDQNQIHLAMKIRKMVNRTIKCNNVQLFEEEEEEEEENKNKNKNKNKNENENGVGKKDGGRSSSNNLSNADSGGSVMDLTKDDNNNNNDNENNEHKQQQQSTRKEEPEQ